MTVDRRTRPRDQVSAAYRQRMMALARANDRRGDIAQLRADIAQLPERDGRQLVAALLRNRDEVVLEMRAAVLLISIRRIGEFRAKQLLRDVGGATTGKRVRELTDRQRSKLADLLAGEAK